MKTTQWTPARVAPFLAAAALLAAVGPALADAPACEANYQQSGNLVTGRQFSTWEVLPGVKPAEAFQRILTDGMKSGLRVASSDKGSGTISFEQTATRRGMPINLPWNIVIAASGKGSKVSVTKSTPGAFPTSEDAQKQSMCMVIGSARGK